MSRSPLIYAAVSIVGLVLLAGCGSTSTPAATVTVTTGADPASSAVTSQSSTAIASGSPTGTASPTISPTGADVVFKYGVDPCSLVDVSAVQHVTGPLAEVRSTEDSCIMGRKVDSADMDFRIDDFGEDGADKVLAYKRKIAEEQGTVINPQTLTGGAFIAKDSRGAYSITWRSDSIEGQLNMSTEFADTLTKPQVELEDLAIGIDKKMDSAQFTITVNGG